MARRYSLISADTHAGGDLLDYKPYLAKKWHESFDAWAAAFKNPFADIDPEQFKDLDPALMAMMPDPSLNWDSDKRLAGLEAQGVVAEAILPNTVPPFFEPGCVGGLANLSFSSDSYEQRWAGLQAHNRWLLDFCQKSPSRRAGVIQILPNRIEDAVAEIRWAAANFKKPFGGILFPTLSPGRGMPQIWQDHFEPLWQVCEELDVPINVHGANGLPDYGNSDNPDQSVMQASPIGNAVMMFEIAWFSRRSTVHMILSGVFERHPGLRVVLVEQGVGWVPHVLEGLDGTFRRFTTGVTGSVFSSGLPLKMLPSEYFRRNVWHASFLRPSEAPIYREAGILDRVMWGADYPHGEGTAPHTIESLRAAFSGTPADDVEAMVFSNAVKCYGFDGSAIKKIGDKIGPDADEVRRPLAAEDYPEGAGSWSFETEPAHTAL